MRAGEEGRAREEWNEGGGSVQASEYAKTSLGMRGEERRGEVPALIAVGRPENEKGRAEPVREGK